MATDPEVLTTLLNERQAPVSGTRYRTSRDLTLAQRWLVRVIEAKQFGRIENLPIAAGMPIPDRRTKIIRVARLGANAGPVPTRNADGDFELQQATSDLFDEFERVANGLVHRLEFRHGQPFQVETTAAADDFVQQSGLVS